MIERKHRYGNLNFDCKGIVRAALWAYVEGIVRQSPCCSVSLSFAAAGDPEWTGDLQRGALRNDDGCGNHNVVAWSEAGVVGLAYELGFGPLEHLDLPPSAVTGGPEDVRGALPNLPAKLEPTFEMAVKLLHVGSKGEKLAGVGFWLSGDQTGGSFFYDPCDAGAKDLARWALLQGGRLLPSIAFRRDPSSLAAVAECARREAPTHAVIDTVVDRRLHGPTEFTAEEIAMLFHPSPDPKQLLPTQRLLAKAGITWPGSPKLPPKELPPGPLVNPFTGQPLTEAEIKRLLQD